MSAAEFSAILLHSDNILFFETALHTIFSRRFLPTCIPNANHFNYLHCCELKLFFNTVYDFAIFFGLFFCYMAVFALFKSESSLYSR